jgi:hypothetical protein
MQQGGRRVGGMDKNSEVAFGSVEYLDCKITHTERLTGDWGGLFRWGEGRPS